MNKFIKSLRIVVMPKLSPTMSHGTIVNMTLQPKQIVSSYDKIMEVSTHSLLNTSEEQSTMDIEVMEDMFVAKVMVKSGQQMKVGTPIALLCDNEEDIEKAENWEVPASYNSYTALGGSQDIPMAIWQAYAKEEIVGCK